MCIRDSLYSGAQLTEEGFLVDLSESTSGGKAYWFEAVGEDTMQVVYADEKIETYESSVSGDVMTVKVTGQPDTMGTVIVANSAENTGRVVSIQLDADGQATLEIPADKLYAPQGGQAGLGRATRVEFEGWYKNGEMCIRDREKAGRHI